MRQTEIDLKRFIIVAKFKFKVFKDAFLFSKIILFLKLMLF